MTECLALFCNILKSEPKKALEQIQNRQFLTHYSEAYPALQLNVAPNQNPLKLLDALSDDQLTEFFSDIYQLVSVRTMRDTRAISCRAVSYLTKRKVYGDVLRRINPRKKPMPWGKLGLQQLLTEVKNYEFSSMIAFQRKKSVLYHVCRNNNFPWKTVSDALYNRRAELIEAGTFPPLKRSQKKVTEAKEETEGTEAAVHRKRGRRKSHPWKSLREHANDSRALAGDFDKVFRQTILTHYTGRQGNYSTVRLVRTLAQAVHQHEITGNCKDMQFWQLVVSNLETTWAGCQQDYPTLASKLSGLVLKTKNGPRIAYSALFNSTDDSSCRTESSEAESHSQQIPVRCSGMSSDTSSKIINPNVQQSPLSSNGRICPLDHDEAATPFDYSECPSEIVDS
jgi:hypothetical protein